MDLNGLKIQAISIGGIQTCIAVPSYKICFDIGACPPFAVRCKRVFFTHCHVDHMGGVIHHVARRSLMSMSPPTYYLQSADVPRFEKMLQAWRELSGSTLPCSVVGVDVGDVIDMGKRKKVQVFRSFHRQSTVGYALIVTKNKLLDEFKHLSGPEIGAKRAAGETIAKQVTAIELAFCGDTNTKVLDEPLVANSQRLILECTFVDGNLERARHTGHVHLAELAQQQAKLNQPCIVLSHFSRRASKKAIRHAVKSALSPELFSRVHLLLSEDH